MRSPFVTIVVLLLLVTPFGVVPAVAQTYACGEIIQGEFTKPQETLQYSISLSPGDTLEVTGAAIGERLGFMLGLLNQAGEALAVSEAGAGLYRPVLQPSFNSGVLSATGTYSIVAYNDRMYIYSADMNYQRNVNDIGSIGAFTLKLNCILANGEVIEAGVANPGNNDSGGQGTNPAPVPAPFTGNGFPGLAPVDFSNAFVFPLALGQANPGQIPAGADAIISYTFDAQAGQAFDLTFTRTSGNLNLGLVVLNAENQVVFQSSLVAANRVNAQLTLPSSGIYTIGVFRIDLLPPAAPEATGFQIEAVLG